MKIYKIDVEVMNPQDYSYDGRAGIFTKAIKQIVKDLHIYPEVGDEVDSCDGDWAAKILTRTFSVKNKTVYYTI